MAYPCSAGSMCGVALTPQQPALNLFQYNEIVTLDTPGSKRGYILFGGSSFAPLNGYIVNVTVQCDYIVPENCQQVVRQTCATSGDCPSSRPICASNGRCTSNEDCGSPEPPVQPPKQITPLPNLVSRPAARETNVAQYLKDTDFGWLDWFWTLINEQ